MSARAISTFFGLVATLGAGAALAQQQATVAQLTNLDGTVLVSQSDGLAAAANKQRVAAGTRVVTTAGAKVTINYDIGCEIALNENERFTIRIGECRALSKEIVTLGPAPAAIGGAVGGATTGAVGATAGIAGIIVVGNGMANDAREVFKKHPVVPN